MSTSRIRTTLAGIAALFVVSAALATEPAAAPAGARRAGPPPIAIRACNGAGEGDACTFSGLYGERIAGTCKQIGEQLACVPADLPEHAG